MALDGVNFSVPAGTILGLLGPNGAGKTTAVRVLTTIIRPDAGRASVLGYDVVRDADAVRYRIGLAGQYAAVDGNLTGRENLRLIGRLTQLPRRRIAARADELLGALRARRRRRSGRRGPTPAACAGASTWPRPSSISLLCSSWTSPPRGLDPHGRLELWNILRELVADGTTVLLTTQYLDEADRLAHRIVVIDRGRIIAEGSPAELKARVGSTVIEIELADEAEALRAEPLLAPFGAGCGRDGRKICIKVDDGARVLVDVLRALDAAQLAPVTLAVREPSLDDAFLALTGRHAEPVPMPDQQTVGTRGGA